MKFFETIIHLLLVLLMSIVLTESIYSLTQLLGFDTGIASVSLRIQPLFVILAIAVALLLRTILLLFEVRNVTHFKKLGKGKTIYVKEEEK